MEKKRIDDLVYFVASNMVDSSVSKKMKEMIPKRFTIAEWPYTLGEPAGRCRVADTDECFEKLLSDRAVHVEEAEVALRTWSDTVLYDATFYTKKKEWEHFMGTTIASPTEFIPVPAVLLAMLPNGSVSNSGGAKIGKGVYKAIISYMELNGSNGGIYVIDGKSAYAVQDCTPFSVSTDWLRNYGAVTVSSRTPIKEFFEDVFGASDQQESGYEGIRADIYREGML